MASKITKTAGRVDWPAVVESVELAGVSQREIDARCGASTTWAHRLKSIPGTQPKYDQGAVLIRLWSELTGRPAESVPREV